MDSPEMLVFRLVVGVAILWIAAGMWSLGRQIDPHTREILRLREEADRGE